MSTAFTPAATAIGTALCLLAAAPLAAQPKAGGVALWVGPGTEGYFSDLKISGK